MLLEVLLGGRGQLDGSELVAPPLEAANDLADEATLDSKSVTAMGRAVVLSFGHTWTPSGLTAMKLLSPSVSLFVC